MIEIRSAVAADAAAVARLLGQLVGYDVAVEAVGGRLRRLAATGADPVFLACDSGIAVGLVALHFAPMLHYARPALRITNLVVDHRHRRRGVGRALIVHAEREAAAAGCEIIELTSVIDNTEAHAFYRSLGFEANSLRFRKLPPG
ncbi:MAG TPA: GNAT family N-acetyltransferase [Stellaceae bacterium]|jgi:ribosomal protein S18 acetylase RimI-like enzyme